MKLTELEPRWAENPEGNRYLNYRCPTCPEDVGHRNSIPVDNKTFPNDTWKSNGERDFEMLTISPSLQQHCKTRPHFFIREGEIQIV